MKTTVDSTAKQYHKTDVVHSYDTVSEALNDLARRGYTANLYLCADKKDLLHNGSLLELSPNKFRIDEIYRFEGNTDPGDEMIVFAISSRDEKVKGVLVNAFGVYSSASTSALVSHLAMHLNNR